MNYKMQAA